jgi:hypothetical protein
LQLRGREDAVLHGQVSPQSPCDRHGVLRLLRQGRLVARCAPSSASKRRTPLPSIPHTRAEETGVACFFVRLDLPLL